MISSVSSSSSALQSLQSSARSTTQGEATKLKSEIAIKESELKSTEEEAGAEKL
jgi:hypothetical protein